MPPWPRSQLSPLPPPPPVLLTLAEDILQLNLRPLAGAWLFAEERCNHLSTYYSFHAAPPWLLTSPGGCHKRALEPKQSLKNDTPLPSLKCFIGPWILSADPSGFPKVRFGLFFFFHSFLPFYFYPPSYLNSVYRELQNTFAKAGKKKLNNSLTCAIHLAKFLLTGHIYVNISVTVVRRDIAWTFVITCEYLMCIYPLDSWFKFQYQLFLNKPA